MKVSELIALLQQQNPDAEVLMEDADLAASLSSDGDETLGGNQRLASIEAGYADRIVRDIDTEIPFTIQPHEPVEIGVPAVRLLGVHTEPTRPDMVRRALENGWFTTAPKGAEVPVFETRMVGGMMVTVIPFS